MVDDAETSGDQGAVAPGGAVAPRSARRSGARTLTTAGRTVSVVTTARWGSHDVERVCHGRRTPISKRRAA